MDWSGFWTITSGVPTVNPNPIPQIGHWYKVVGSIVVVIVGLDVVVDTDVGAIDGAVRGDGELNTLSGPVADGIDVVVLMDGLNVVFVVTPPSTSPFVLVESLLPFSFPPNTNTNGTIAATNKMNKPTRISTRRLRCRRARMALL